LIGLSAASVTDESLVTGVRDTEESQNHIADEMAAKSIRIPNGAAVGAKVGEATGDDFGAKAGEEDGDSVGVKVGKTDGDGEGSNEGDVERLVVLQLLAT
jgi:hypothetical protein